MVRKAEKYCTKMISWLGKAEQKRICIESVQIVTFHSFFSNPCSTFAPFVFVVCEADALVFGRLKQLRGVCKTPP